MLIKGRYRESQRGAGALAALPVLEAKVLGKEHREKYSNRRPHSSLEDLTPVEFASRCLAPLRPTASVPQDSEINNKQKSILS